MYRNKIETTQSENKTKQNKTKHTFPQYSTQLNTFPESIMGKTINKQTED
jgi:hypothetical protein